MPVPTPPRLPSGPLSASSADDLNRFFTELSRASNITVASQSKLRYTWGADGYQLNLDVEEVFQAKILSGSSPYAWQEVVHTGGTTYAAKTGGRSGTATVSPAYEFNGSTSVAANTIVLMLRGTINATTGVQYVFMLGWSGLYGSPTGYTGTVSFLKPDCTTGTITFSNGLATGAT